jgi:AmmeMemoRadiSam system protein B
MLHIDQPVPPLRRDIDILSMEDNGEVLAVLYDRAGYAEEPMTLYVSVMSILEMADGVASVRDLATSISAQTGETLSAESLLEFFSVVEKGGFLDSPSFRARKEQKDREFFLSPVREPACAGSSYADNAAKLTAFLDTVMKSADNHPVAGNARAIVAPHIDLRVGAETYAPAYRALRDSDADVFVIFGTSHYGWQDLFLLTEKNFRTPLGMVQTDTALVQDIRKRLPFELCTDDLAHRDEHSIEFQLLFLQHLFGDRPFTVLPILVTSFHSFVEKKMFPNNSGKFRHFIDALRESIDASGKKAAFIASADMAHVGKKFGDEFSAASLLDTLAREDADILKNAAAVDTPGFFSGIAGVNDCRRICGLPPVYSMLEAVRPRRGEVLDYRQWHEKETESAVTFASLAYYD